MTDMTSSEPTKQPMLPDTSSCVADQNDELSKDSFTDYVRKTDEKPVPFSSDRARAAGQSRNLPEFLTRKLRACFLKTR